MRFAVLGLGVVIAFALAACGSTFQSSFGESASSTTGAETRYRPPPGFKPDLVTPDGVSVQTNGQYKTEAQRKAAAAAIDKYWTEVQKCATTALGASDVSGSVPEFPGHLSIEIANNWKVVEGPTTHRRTQAFPSLVHPGSWSTSLAKPDNIYILAVPELNGLGPQMAAELELWLKRNATTSVPDLANACLAMPCYRFDYDNAPSQAWRECVD
ncbi:MAG TPA: hypothetical protein VEU51_01170 [Candidatus Acidoferrales bacterium]|nr:hypothetical protein [Candidatus Acidoferrales bacterium]